MTSIDDPEPLRSYFTSGTLHDIQLYSGRAGIAYRDGLSVPVQVDISLTWTPVPHIAATARTSQHIPWTDDGLHLELPLLLSLNHGFPFRASGRMVQLNDHPSGKPMSSAVLVLDDVPSIGDWDHHPATWISVHLINALDFAGAVSTTERSEDQVVASMNRLVIENSHWKATLDSASNARELLGEAVRMNGYAVTHMAKVETFTSALDPARARQCVEELCGTLTIATGSRVGACLIEAYDSSDRGVWQTWVTPNTQPYPGARGCLPRGYTQHGGRILHPDLSGLSQGYTDLIAGADSQLLLRLVDWSLNAVHYDAATSIVFSVAGLELLTYWELVLTQGMSADGFQKMRVPDQLRLFLSACRIPHSIPPTLTALESLVKSGGQVQDGPSCVADFRNGLVHPPTRKRAHVNDAELLHEASALALWYFELAVLRLLGYAGAYRSRVSKEPRAVIVPWAEDAGKAFATLQ